MNFFFHHFEGFSTFPRRNKNQKRTIFCKGVSKLDNLFKLIVNKTSIFDWFYRNSSTYLIKAGCSF